MQEITVPATWYYAVGGGKWESAMEVVFTKKKEKDVVVFKLYDEKGVDVTEEYKMETLVTVDDGGMNVKWRVEQSSKQRLLVAGFTIGQANKEVRSSAFVVASKPSYLRKKRKRREISMLPNEPERLPEKVMRLLWMMQETIMHLETRMKDMEDHQHTYDAISNFTLDDFPGDPCEPIHFE